MTPAPDTIAVQSVADGRELAVTGGLSGLSAVSSLVAMAQALPMNGAIALGGIVASALIQIVRMWSDNRIAGLTRDNLHLQAAARAADARETVHLQRIAALVAQLDTANAARERMMAALLEHAGEMGTDIHRAVAEAAKPAPAPVVPSHAPAEPVPVEPTGSEFIATDHPDDHAPGGVS